MEDVQTRHNRLRDQFTEFLDSDELHYKEKIEDLIESRQKRLIISIDDLRHVDSELASNLIQNPVDYVPPFQIALEKIVEKIDYETSKTNYLIGFCGNFGANHMTPRNLLASFFGQLICLEGIVTRCYELRCKVIKSVHYCKATNDQFIRNYSDLVSLSGKKTATVYPKTDDAGNPLTTEFGLSVYEDYQRVTIQEMPERTPAGQLPRSIDVILSCDLVDKLKPGDRARVFGIYRALPSKSGGSTSGIFKSVIIANHLELLVSTGSKIQLSQNDLRLIKKFASTYKGKVFHKLAMAIAPSIYGHEYIKRAILCQLIGGLEKNLENGTHIRGDLNILLVGDPSTAKSQLLRSAMTIAPLSIATTGRGSSGVGLTAAVLTDKDTGEKRLEAGAMVLGDRGLVCIDEFDKMSDADRVAIHEVMEQQTVTINKAGIHIALNARCSVLAAANPVYGQYRTDLSVMENVALPDSLLSRFDFLFIILDEIDPILDRKVAEHVLLNHLYRPANEPDGFVDSAFVFGCNFLTKVDSESEGDDEDESWVYAKHNVKLRGPLKSLNDRIVSTSFLKKYLYYAKLKIKPLLSSSACRFICQSYASLRDNRRLKTLPITARTLETLIRLSTSIAKLRLSPTVSKRDASQALDLLHFALYGEEASVELNNATFHEAKARAKRYRKSAKRRLSKRLEERGEEVSEVSDEISDSETSGRTSSSTASSSDEDSEEGQSQSDDLTGAKRQASESLPSSSSPLTKRNKEHVSYESLPQELVSRFHTFLSEALEVYNRKDRIILAAVGQLGVSEAEAEAILIQMMKESKIFIHGNDVFRT